MAPFFHIRQSKSGGKVEAAPTRAVLASQAL